MGLLQSQLMTFSLQQTPVLVRITRTSSGTSEQIQQYSGTHSLWTLYQHGTIYRTRLWYARRWRRSSPAWSLNTANSITSFSLAWYSQWEVCQLMDRSRFRSSFSFFKSINRINYRKCCFFASGIQWNLLRILFHLTLQERMILMHF